MKNLKLAEIALEGYQRNSRKEFRVLDETGADTGLKVISQSMGYGTKAKWSFQLLDTNRKDFMGLVVTVDHFSGKNYEQVEKRVLKRAAEYLDE